MIKMHIKDFTSTNSQMNIDNVCAVSVPQGVSGCVLTLEVR